MSCMCGCECEPDSIEPCDAGDDCHTRQRLEAAKKALPKTKDEKTQRKKARNKKKNEQRRARRKKQRQQQQQQQKPLKKAL